MDRVVALARRMGLSHIPVPVLVVFLCASVLVAIVGFWRWAAPSAAASDFEAAAAPGRSEPASVESSASAAPVAVTPSVAPEPVKGVFVHVTGAVVHPGVYELEAGDRVSDAIGLAGGLAGNAEERAVNLARPITDGEQIVVPTQDEFDRGQVVAAPSTGGTSGRQEGGGTSAGTPTEPAGPLDLNTASAKELETLPGIGPVTAAKIVEDRERNGPFASVDELVRVSGIGEKKLEAVRDLVVVR